LFDLDGTLADTAPDLAAAVNKMRIDRSGWSQLPLTMLRPLASAGARGLIGAAFGIAPGHEAYDALRTEFFANYAANIAEHTCLFDGVNDLLGSIEITRWNAVGHSDQQARAVYRCAGSKNTDWDMPDASSRATPRRMPNRIPNLCSKPRVNCN
jgi:beta-phosphoglucomutase-like phosphatase (HAD superfamily)